MTDRLAELRQGRSLSSASAPEVDDIETGLRAEQDAVLTKFNREADAIDKVYVWADKSIRSVHTLLNDAAQLGGVEQQLEVIEKKLDAVRKRLKRIAGENKELATSKNVVPSSLRIRVARYTKLGKDFMAVTTKLESAREEHKQALLRGMKRDVMRANPGVAEETVDRALESEAALETVLQRESGLRHEIDDLRARNKDIEKLSRNIVELHQMFTDMSILVENQQELINDIEYNVKEVKVDTKKAADELEVARKHQKSARKKKMCICVLVIIIIVAVLAAILIPIGVKNGWFGGNGNSSNSSSPSSRSGIEAPDSIVTFKSMRWYE